MPDVVIHEETGRPGRPVSHRWYCRDCRDVGRWTTDRAAAEAGKVTHRCPDTQNAAPRST